MKIHITDIQRFCIHDGPGLRTTVFMNGCPLSCKWCHNPEAQLTGNRIFYTDSKCIGCGACSVCSAHTFSEAGHLFRRESCTSCGRCAEICPSGALMNTVITMDTAEVAAEVLKDAAFYGEDGGVTLSGGEPLWQTAAALELLQMCREHGLHTAVETCGVFRDSCLPVLSSSADLLLWDIKDTDNYRHKENTGVPLDPIQENLFSADRLGIPIRLRCLLLEGINANEEHIDQVCRLAGKLKHLEGIDLIPYHPMGKSKYERLGISDTFDNKRYIPSQERLEALQKIVNGCLKTL
ncbi:MAG: glycyl-radical enzyme activating protein [Clostridiales bacterium]|nr:glycyl-radical enzyme activating protein [Clostridiales bacterium]